MHIITLIDIDLVGQFIIVLNINSTVIPPKNTCPISVLIVTNRE